ncbi:MAG: winged helix-turn-helix transcriptional regulator, partial [Anaerolineales bacterium]|nr:winged helix-turn-helix transcriptional regulator [Anaerolineales bacterium]
LKLKGLLGTSNPPQIFSPIFIHFVLNQANTWDQAIKMDEPTRRVWVWGKPTSPLTALEFRVFRLLYEYVGEVVERDEIVEAGWPDAEGGVTDTAVNQMVRRLREKIEPDRQNPQFLESVRGQGYRLNTENSLL